MRDFRFLFHPCRVHNLVGIPKWLHNHHHNDDHVLHCQKLPPTPKTETGPARRHRSKDSTTNAARAAKLPIFLMTPDALKLNHTPNALRHHSHQENVERRDLRKSREWPQCEEEEAHICSVVRRSACEKAEMIHDQRGFELVKRTVCCCGHCSSEQRAHSRRRRLGWRQRTSLRRPTAMRRAEESSMMVKMTSRGRNAGDMAA